MLAVFIIVFIIHFTIICIIANGLAEGHVQKWPKNQRILWTAIIMVASFVFIIVSFATVRQYKDALEEVTEELDKEYNRGVNDAIMSAKLIEADTHGYKLDFNGVVNSYIFIEDDNTPTLVELDHLRTRVCHVTALLYEEDEVVVVDDFGYAWVFYGIEDWHCNDGVILLMHDNNTPMIEDDIILTTTYFYDEY